jgi:uncharacterized protein
MYAKIEADIKRALLNGDKATAEALRFLKSVLMNARISVGHELSEEETVKAIRKEMKLRIEARDMYAANQRSELAAKEEFERNLFAHYLPEEMNEQQLISIIETIAHKIPQPVKFGELMSAVMKEVAGKVDGKTVAELINKYIGGEKA